jgi:Arc/MetJ-type ribon-helix-helix transcriptional regulator
MPGSPRITIRLTPALETLMSARVRQGSSVSDIVRQALEAYLGTCRTESQTSTSPVSGNISGVSDELADNLSADLSDTMSARLSAIASDVSDIRERLAQLEVRLDALSASIRPPNVRQRVPHSSAVDRHPRPAPLGGYDVDLAYARMQALQGQGMSLAQIAAQLTAEGLRTRHGKAWHKSTVAYILKTHGR